MTEPAWTEAQIRAAFAAEWAPEDAGPMADCLMEQLAAGGAAVESPAQPHDDPRCDCTYEPAGVSKFGCPVHDVPESPAQPPTTHEFRSGYGPNCGKGYYVDQMCGKSPEHPVHVQRGADTPQPDPAEDSP